MPISFEVYGNEWYLKKKQYIATKVMPNNYWLNVSGCFNGLFLILPVLISSRWCLLLLLLLLFMYLVILNSKSHSLWIILAVVLFHKFITSIMLYEVDDTYGDEIDDGNYCKL